MWHISDEGYMSKDFTWRFGHQLFLANIRSASRRWGNRWHGRDTPSTKRITMESLQVIFAGRDPPRLGSISRSGIVSGYFRHIELKKMSDMIEVEIGWSQAPTFEDIISKILHYLEACYLCKWYLAGRIHQPDFFEKTLDQASPLTCSTVETPLVSRESKGNDRDDQRCYGFVFSVWAILVGYTATLFSVKEWRLSQIEV